MIFIMTQGHRDIGTHEKAKVKIDRSFLILVLGF